MSAALPLAVYTVIIQVAAVVFDQAVSVDSPFSPSIIMYATRTFPMFKCILAPLHAFRFTLREIFLSFVFASAGTITCSNFIPLRVRSHSVDRIFAGGKLFKIGGVDCATAILYEEKVSLEA